ncbi:MAG: Ni/Fe-hydrogenase cytochrome b subunit [Planctomycetes bacterium]|nr:Ni/Fe-hydrogenase cytochrome b subunit [Planctomycetota bacterium]
MYDSTSNPTLHRVKSILWMAMGVWTVVTIARFANGIGATSGLTDVAPWGFWIAFDVMAGVALAAGGFVLAAAVYIFGLQKYHDFARPAILTALLGYIAVAVGLLYDLGLPWNIWHPMIFPQHHSVLFEVAMCVMLYLTVLTLEFTPTVLEHPLFSHRVFQVVLKVVKKLTIPLVIAGICLSTLHQSSLGSLFLIQPFRTHPLWYSPMLPVLFFVSAVGLGLMMVTLESLLSSWLFNHKVRVDLLAGLGRMASFVLSVYVLLRVGDLLRRGQLSREMIASWQGGLFILEMLVSAVVPAVLLAIPRVRHSIPGLATCSAMTVLGVIAYRFDACIIAFTRPTTMPYYPTWTELAVSVGVVSGAALVFVFFNENLRIVPRHDDPRAAGLDERAAGFSPRGAPNTDASRACAADDPTAPYLFTPERRKYSLGFIIAGALAIGLLPEQAIFGPQPQPVPVQEGRNLEALAVKVDSPLRREFHIASLAGNVPASVNPEPVTLRLIDGNRNWRFVPFTHDDHIDSLGGRESCRLCHHQNMTFDQTSPCYLCHRDMYETTDTFKHMLHVDKLGGNASCAVCHGGGPGRKSRENSLACWQCHGDMVVEDSVIPPAKGGLKGFAPGYMDAMHGLCIGCHADLAKRRPDKYGEEFARCDVCHRDFEDLEHRRMAPYIPMPPGHERVDRRKATAAASAPSDGS